MAPGGYLEDQFPLGTCQVPWQRGREGRFHGFLWAFSQRSPVGFEELGDPAELEELGAGAQAVTRRCGDGGPLGRAVFLFGLVTW